MIDDEDDELKITFIEWLRKNYNYTGDGTVEDIQSKYSFYEVGELYELYLENPYRSI